MASRAVIISLRRIDYVRWCIALAAALACLCAPAFAQSGERRVALIIANAAYVTSPALPPAPAVAEDAAVMEAALRRAGFAVTIVHDQTRRDMLLALSAFGRSLADGGASNVGFLYYAGHAIGVRDDNYLLPVDAQVESATDLPIVGVSLRRQIDAISIAGARAAIIVLDASRTTFGRGSRGLVAEPARTDTLIAYSSQPGALIAQEGVYARSLADELARPGADTATAFARVNTVVALATQRAQIPRYDNGLIDQFVFTPQAGAAAPSMAPSAPARERLHAGQMFQDCPECPEMIVAPGGTFIMGSPEGEAGRYANEGPQHRVNIRSFAIARTEVTFDQWAACARAGGCASNPSPGDSGWGRGRRPALNVSWTDAQDYVRWLNARTGGGYRLLSESEWEYAARAGAATRFWWGEDDPICDLRALNGAAFAGCPDERTHPVASFSAANPFGLFDMSGNVSEWTQDCLVEGQIAPADGSARDAATCSIRVVRGGSWASQPRSLRAANRSWETPINRVNFIGFRVAKTLE